MTNRTASNTLKDASDLFQQTFNTFADLLQQSTNLGFDLLNSLGAKTSSGFDFSSIKLPKMQGCGCKIPPPCWMPSDAGCVVSHVCPGSGAILCIRITNCGPTARTITLDDGGKNRVSFQPASVVVGPMETAVVSATLAGSSKSCDESEESVLIWIHGCKKHFIRWTIKTAKRGVECCHEICVEDCPDYLHHWYDHFYCARPCTSEKGNG